MNKYFFSVFLLGITILGSCFFAHKVFSAQTVLENNDLVKYKGSIKHIFFHSLIIYPKKAKADRKNASGYRDYMITVNQFKQIIQQLYENNFVLINSESFYSFNDNGKLKRPALYLPKGKKPLIISLDDLVYYNYMKDGGFAHKLVLDNGVVKTEVITPEGNKIVTDDGDVVPIVDKFVKEHPDFSLNGGKGIIALTGFEGILGYRTQLKNPQNATEKVAVLPIVDALKKSGWTFANHSFTHDPFFLKDTISTRQLADDISRWKKEVEPLIGPTNIFIGPFGEVFKEGDPRRQQLIDAGFNVLYGVGMDGYIRFFDNHFVMNRIDLDGYRLTHNAKTLYKLFGISVK